MATLLKIDKKECIEKLQKEGFSNIKVCPLPPYTDEEEHNHEHDQVNIILSGELTISDKNGTKTYLAGDRVEVAAGTIHKAKGCPNGGEMITAIKEE